MKASVGVGVALLAAALLGVAASSSIFKAVVIATVGCISIAGLLAHEMSVAMRLGVAGALVASAAFGLAAPWIICRRPPYDVNLCPQDRASRSELQKERLKWFVTLSLVSIGLFWWEIKDVFHASKKLAKSLGLFLAHFWWI